ncbi:RtcB family protein [Candidatus Microgenomates bacterium]|nr:RtcB family protein [Candidatus Microgenomates bacterium]
MIVLKQARLPIKIWAEESDLVGYEEAIAQAVNLANHPLAQKWVALMPDFHIGYGMPVGGVLATQGGVIPNAVGVDIGCGMLAAETNLKKDQLPKDLLQQLRQLIHAKVPVGMKHHKHPQHHPYLKTTSKDPIISTQLKAADTQIGTLGGGNHFIEIQADEEGKVWIMIHSGSRNLGKRVADYYHRKAIDYTVNDKGLPDRDLAYLSDKVPQYQMYLEAMNFCLKFAEHNRENMLKAIKSAFAEVGKPLSVKQQFDNHHNFAALETHYGQKLLIHRKGAIKAEGLVIVPGSMGTASYIGEGLRPSESFNTCAHGAGRTLGRRQANRTISHAQAVSAMRHVVFNVRHGDYDEMPMAYKNIDRIIKLQADLVKPVHKLHPLAVVKG